MALSPSDRLLYKEMYGFAYDELSRGPASGDSVCACGKTRSTGAPCRNSPAQYVGPVLVCNAHIGWAKRAMKKMRLD